MSRSGEKGTYATDGMPALIYLYKTSPPPSASLPIVWCTDSHAYVHEVLAPTPIHSLPSLWLSRP